MADQVGHKRIAQPSSEIHLIPTYKNLHFTSQADITANFISYKYNSQLQTSCPLYFIE